MWTYGIADADLQRFWRRDAKAWCVIALTTLTFLTACSKSRTLEDPEAEPSDIVAAWSEAACEGADVQKPSSDESQVVDLAYCELDTIGSRAERLVNIRIYSSGAGVATMVAAADCDDGYLKMRGPRWYSVMQSRDAATALQDAGGELVC
jgi:hypothetical protein